MSDNPNSFSNVMANLGDLTTKVVEEHRSAGGAPPAPSGGGKRGTAESAESQVERMLGDDGDPPDNGEDALTRRGKGGKGPAKAAKLNLPEPKAAKPKAPPAPPPEAEEGDPDEEQEVDPDEEQEAVDKAVESAIRKLKRYGQEIDIDTSDPMAALEQALAMAGDDARVSMVIDGQEYLVPQGELVHGYQRAAGANKRFADAQALTQQFGDSVQHFRHNPAELLRQMQVEPLGDDSLVVDLLMAVGIDDPVEWAGKFAWTEVERRSMQNPNAPNYDPQKYVRSELERARRAESLMQQRQYAAQQNYYQQQQQQQQQQQFQESTRAFASAMPQALAAAGLPANDMVHKVTWDLYQQALRAGAPVTPAQLAMDARDWLQENVRGTYGQLPPDRFREVFGDEPIKSILQQLAADPDALLEYVPKEVVQAIRKADTRRVQARNRQPRNSEHAAQAPTQGNGAGPRPGGRMTMADARELLKSGQIR